MKKKKTPQEKWPDDDLSPEFINNQVKHLEQFGKIKDRNRNSMDVGDSPETNQLNQNPNLHKFKSVNYLFKSINNRSTLPYHYPPIKKIHGTVTSFDERTITESIASHELMGKHEISKKLKHAVDEIAHEEQLEQFHISPVKNSFAARSFKQYLKTQDVQSMELLDLFEPTPGDESDSSN